MIIRTAEAEDAASIAAIWNQAIRHTTVTFTTKEKCVATIGEMIAAQRTWVAQDTEIAGFATLGPFRKGPGYARTAEQTIYISPDFQGRGAGRGLLEVLQDGARRDGIRTLIAAIGGEAEASQAFHARMGFVQVGHLPGIGEKFGRRHDLILMQKEI